MNVPNTFLTELTRLLTPQCNPQGITFIGIDGVDGVGKSTLAAAWTHHLKQDGYEVILASVDGFHNPRTIRYQQGKHSPQGFYEDSYNYDGLTSALLEPLKTNKPYQSAIFDHTTDSEVEPQTSPHPGTGLLIFEGIFLHRPELRGFWDFSVFLEAPFETTVPRGNQRFDGLSNEPGHADNRRYVQGQKIYFERCQPQQRATVVVDYRDVSLPVIKYSTL